MNWNAIPAIYRPLHSHQGTRVLKNSTHLGLAGCQLSVSRRAALLHTFGLTTAALANATLSRTTCELSDRQLDSLLGNKPIYAIQSDSSMVLSSGNPAFDRSLGRHLILLAKAFEVHPGFAFVDDSPSPNAAASRETRLPGTSGTVLFGLMLLNALLNGEVGGDIAVIGVCAHEFAHIHQFEVGYDRKFTSTSSPVKLMELHADFLAGYFVGKLKLTRPSITLRFFGKKLYGMGTYDATSPDFHGTPQERLASAEAGALLAGSAAPFSSVSKAGYLHVLDRYSKS